MNIGTKFNIGDEVYFMRNNCVVENSILNIEINCFIDTIQILYGFSALKNGKSRDFMLYEHDCFANKQELIDSL